MGSGGTEKEELVGGGQAGLGDKAAGAGTVTQGGGRAKTRLVDRGEANEK